MAYNKAKIAAELDIKEDEIISYDEENIYPLTVKTETAAKKSNRDYKPVDYETGIFYFIP
jgi:hypothetical protein